MAKKKTAEPAKKRPGRPASGRKRPCTILFYMTAEERAVIDAAAKREGMKPTVWGLRAMLAAATITAAGDM